MAPEEEAPSGLRVAAGHSSLFLRESVLLELEEQGGGERPGANRLVLERRERVGLGGRFEAARWSFPVEFRLHRAVPAAAHGYVLIGEAPGGEWVLEHWTFGIQRGGRFAHGTCSEVAAEEFMPGPSWGAEAGALTGGVYVAPGERTGRPAVLVRRLHRGPVEFEVLDGAVVHSTSWLLLLVASELGRERLLGGRIDGRPYGLLPVEVPAEACRFMTNLSVARLADGAGFVYLLHRPGRFLEYEGRPMSWTRVVALEDTGGVGRVGEVRVFGSQEEAFAHYGKRLLKD